MSNQLPFTPELSPLTVQDCATLIRQYSCTLGYWPGDLLVLWPELLHPVDLPHKPRRQNLRSKRGTRNFQRDHVAYLVPLRRWGMVVLGPLAQSPIWRRRLA
jgi:hypothetical protein